MEKRTDTSTIASHVGAEKSPVGRMLLGAVVATGIIFGILGVFFIFDWFQTRPCPSEISAANAPKLPTASSPKKVSVLPDAEPRRPLDSKELYAQASPAVVTIIVRDEQGQQFAFGSGFFASSDGTVVTNYHVIR